MSWLKTTLCFILFSAIIAQSSDNFMGCQGLIKPSEELLKLYKEKTDFSSISVKLADSDNYVSEEETSSPQGLFVIPIYNAGAYKISLDGIKGWSVEPKDFSVSMNADGSIEGCDDLLIFTVTGFTLSGQVLDFAGVTGVPDVSITISKSPKEEPIHLTTNINGEFSVSSLVSGTYKVTASHPTWSIAEPSTKTIEIGFNNASMSEPFHVSGFSISGSLKGINVESTFKDIIVHLQRADHSKVHCEGANVSSNEDQTQCTYTFIDTPDFLFKNVQPGDYAVNYELLNGSSWSFTPGYYAFTIENDGLSLGGFHYNGYTKKGKVVDETGHGVEGVKIVLNDGQHYFTDPDGYYIIQELKDMKYAIRAEKKHLRFSPLDVDMTMSLSLPDISIVSYHVCGSILMDKIPNYIKTVDTFNVLISDNKNIKKQVKTNEEYYYCFNMEPGEYTISVDDKDMDIKFSNAKVTVEKQGYIVDAHLSPIFRTIKGRIQSNSEDLIISLVSTTSASTSYSIAPTEGTFLFKNILPSIYTLSVKSNQSGCWGNTQEGELTNDNVYTTTVDVTEKDVVDVVVPNSLFVFTMNTPLPVTMNIESPSFTKSYVVVKGMTSICLLSDNIYTMSYSGCVESDHKKYTVNPQHASIDIKDDIYTHKVHGDIMFTSSLIPKEVLLVVSKDNEIYKTFTLSHKDASVLNYSIYLPIGSYSLSVSSPGTTLLYTPLSIPVVIKQDTCDAKLTTVEGEEGHVVRGKIVPPLSDVHIYMRQLIDGDLADTIYREAITDLEGNYIFEPIYKQIQYELEAVREGHHFKRSQDGYVFTHKKLSSVSLSILDQFNNPVEGVLLSLSGEGYMQREQSRIDGTQVFGELFPSTYTLLMKDKEHKFSPSYMTIELGEGVAKTIKITSEKVGYSIYGQIKSLSGLPLPLFSVEARSTSGHKEMGISDSNGIYRIRGLKEGQSYTIIVKDNETNDIDHFIPNEYTVTVNKEDIHNQNFVAVYKTKTTSLEGSISGLPFDHEPLTVNVCAGKNCQTKSITESNHFEMNYNEVSPVHVSITPNKNNNFDYVCEEKDVDIKQGQLNTVDVVCSMNPTLDVNTQHINGGSLYLLALICIILFVYLQFDTIKIIFKL